MDNTRAPNWSKEEITALIKGYQQRIDIIDGKFAPTLTSHTKRKAFEEITSEVNAVSTFGGRTKEQVKKKLEDQKSRTRGKAAKLNKHRTATGGGPASTIVFEPHEELLLSTINPQLICGIIKNGDSSVPVSHIDLTKETIESENMHMMNTTTANTYPPDTESISSDQQRKSTQEEESDIIFTPKNDFKIIGSKKRKNFDLIDNKVTSNQAEEMLKIERKKVALIEKLVEMKRLKLQVFFKTMSNNDISVSVEEQELINLFK